jgi:hypothetical protein
LQHGSFLVTRSPHAPEFPGFRDLHPDVPVPKDLVQRLANRMSKILADTAVFGTLEPAETERVRQLESERYSRLDWHTRPRHPT